MKLSVDTICDFSPTDPNLYKIQYPDPGNLFPPGQISCALSDCGICPCRQITPKAVTPEGEFVSYATCYELDQEKCAFGVDCLEHIAEKTIPKVQEIHPPSKKEKETSEIRTPVPETKAVAPETKPVEKEKDEDRNDDLNDEKEDKSNNSSVTKYPKNNISTKSKSSHKQDSSTTITPTTTTLIDDIDHNHNSSSTPFFPIRKENITVLDSSNTKSPNINSNRKPLPTHRENIEPTTKEKEMIMSDSIDAGSNYNIEDTDKSADHSSKSIFPYLIGAFSLLTVAILIATISIRRRINKKLSLRPPGYYADSIDSPPPCLKHDGSVLRASLSRPIRGRR